MIELLSVWQTVVQMGRGFLHRLPYLLMALFVIAGFFLLAKLLRGLIHRLIERRKRRNLGLVLARLSQGALIFMGLLIALSIVLPSLRPAT